MLYVELLSLLFFFLLFFCSSSFFFSVSEYLLRIYCVQGLVLKSGDSAMKEATILCPSGGGVDGPLRESDDI